MEEMKDIAKFNLKYDGEALKDHAIDIDILCPSLEALSKLVKESNKIINKGGPEISVKVNANTEQNCFELLLHLRSIATHSYEISAYLRHFPLYFYYFLSLMKEFKGRIIDPKSVIMKNKVGKIVGDSNIGDSNIINNIYTNSVNIYNYPSVRQHIPGFLGPLKEYGTGEINLHHPIKKHDSTSFDEKTYYGILKNIPIEKTAIDFGETKEILFLPDKVTMLNIKAKKWYFLLGDKNGKRIKVDISETRIAENAENRGGVQFGDKYKVMLKKIIYRTPAGRRRADYKITKVLNFPNDKQ